MVNDLSAVILSCDKNSDLSPFILQTYKSLCSFCRKALIATENNVSPYQEANCVQCGNVSFSERFMAAIEQIESDYCLVLLDDYYLHDENIETKAALWINQCKLHDIDALRIDHLGKRFVSRKTIEKGLCKFTSIQPYEIDFHPTIWKTTVLKTLIKGRKDTPWQLEPLFALFLKDKTACFSKINLEYSELVIQGEFFKKPFVKYCKQSYSGNRKVISANAYRKYRFKTAVRNWLPYPVLYWLRRVLKIDSISEKAKL